MKEGIFFFKPNLDESHLIPLTNNNISAFVEKPEKFVSDLAIIGIYYFNDGEYLQKKINKLIKQDSNAALALLFSDKAPQSKIINKARRLILEREGCL